MRHVLRSMAMVAVLSATSLACRGQPIVGLDHIPTVVNDVEQATADAAALGFSIKPGRAHSDGLRNAHIKFPDGSGIELLAPPPEPVDAISREYAQQLTSGEGPVYLGLHVRDSDALARALVASRLPFRDEDGMVTLMAPALQFVFLVRDNRAPSDRPVHFAHPNTASAMSGTWLALDPGMREQFTALLKALGVTFTRQRVCLQQCHVAQVAHLQNGRIILVDAAHQRIPGRPLLAVEFSVRDLARAPGHIVPQGDPQQRIVAPDDAHGLMLVFTAAASPSRHARPQSRR